MPYVRRNLPNALGEIYNFCRAEVPVSNNGGHDNARYDLQNLIIPGFQRKPDFAYLDILIQGRADSSGLLNYIINVGISGIWTGSMIISAGTFVQACLQTNANEFTHSPTWIRGTENIASYLTMGTTIVPCLYIESAGDNLTLYDVQACLRMYYKN